VKGQLDDDAKLVELGNAISDVFSFVDSLADFPERFGNVMYSQF
jgi:hypothetical protein